MDCKSHFSRVPGSICKVCAVCGLVATMAMVLPLSAVYASGAHPSKRLAVGESNQILNRLQNAVKDYKFPEAALKRAAGVTHKKQCGS